MQVEHDQLSALLPEGAAEVDVRRAVPQASHDFAAAALSRVHSPHDHSTIVDQ